MAHFRDFSDCHEPDMSFTAAACKGGQARVGLLMTRPSGGLAAGWRYPHAFLNLNRRFSLQIVVRDNNVDQALKALKKKMQREGLFREMKLRNHFEKPSEKRAREKAEAVRRARKLHRKKLQREGLLPKTPRVVRPGRP
jgi:small subunit ribosomal protein S21